MVAFLFILAVVRGDCEIPVGSVGHVNVTSESQFKEFQRQGQVFLMGVAASWCSQCCLLEPLYKEVLAVMPAETKLLRVDLAKSPFMKRYIGSSDNLPAIYAGKGDKLHHYNERFHTDRVIDFLRRVITPFQTLTSAEQLEAFMSVPSGNENFLKSVAFLYDDDEEIYTEFERTATELASWVNTQMAVVLDRALIKHAQSKKYIQYLNSLLALKRGSDNKELDLAVHHNIRQWLISNGIGLVEELSPYNFQVYDLIKLPMLVLFMDPNNIHHQDHLNLFRKVARNFQESVKFVWLDGTLHENQIHRQKVGLVTQKLPAVAFNLVDGRTQAFGQGEEITFASLSRFVQDFIDNLLPESAYKPSHVPDPELLNLYKDTQALRAQEFEEKVIAEGLDVLVLFYSSHKSPKSYEIAPYFNQVAKRYKELEFDNVRVYRMDLAVERIPKLIKGDNLPAVYFFPAFHKTPPFTQFTGEATVLPLMFFVQKYADVRFELPNLPHLSPDQVDLYYEQKKELSPERARKVEQSNEARTFDL